MFHANKEFKILIKCALLWRFSWMRERSMKWYWGITLSYSLIMKTFAIQLLTFSLEPSQLWVSWQIKHSITYCKMFEQHWCVALRKKKFDLKWALKKKLFYYNSEQKSFNINFLNQLNSFRLKIILSLLINLLIVDALLTSSQKKKAN